MPTENERKWLLPEDSLPADFPHADEQIKIRQAYPTRPDRPIEVRVRESRDVIHSHVEHTLGVKSCGSSKDRFEMDPRGITYHEFQCIWSRCKDCRLTKTRFVYPLGQMKWHQPGMKLEVDVFDDIDLRIAEIEFDDRESLEKYDPPPGWFGEEVTGKDAYRNASLSVHVPPSVT